MPKTEPTAATPPEKPADKPDKPIPTPPPGTLPGQTPTPPPATPGPPDTKPPKEPKPEELPPPPPVAPEAVAPTAVETVKTPEGEKKYGWQDASPEDFTVKDPCVHMGVVQAKSQIVNHEIGHEWVCTCGTIFEVTINKGGKKTLSPKPVAAQLPVTP